MSRGYHYYCLDISNSSINQNRISARMRKKDDEIDISQWEASPWEPASEAGTSRTLKTLWFPTSTIPTLKSGQIVYGCASLVSSGTSLWLYSAIGTTEKAVCFEQLRRSLGDTMALPDVGSLGEGGVIRGPEIFVFWSPACSPP